MTINKYIITLPFLRIISNYSIKRYTFTHLSKFVKVQELTELNLINSAKDSIQVLRILLVPFT